MMQEMSAKGLELIATFEVSELESALIRALNARIPFSTGSKVLNDYSSLYADAMQKVYQMCPSNLDIITLYIDAAMNITPWELFDVYTGLPNPKSRSKEIAELFERALRLPNASNHVGLLHLYIHFVEMSARPEGGLPAANALLQLAPDCGHLVHMSSHIFVLKGEYRRSVEANQRAVVADSNWQCKGGLQSFYTFYIVHNMHFIVYSAMLSGQYTAAIDAAVALENLLTADVLRCKSPPLEDWLEALLSKRLHVYIRFGKWKEILDSEIPSDNLYCVTIATHYYARGIAYAALGQVEAAEQSQSRFEKAVRDIPASRVEYPNKCTDIMRVASAMLKGEINFRRGHFDAAFRYLEEAVCLEDSLIFTEPYGWMQPTRHALGALLMERNHVEKALDLYAADLGFNNQLPKARQHPLNVWALAGYLEALQKLGRKEDARKVEELFRTARENADMDIRVSCFCRRDAPA